MEHAGRICLRWLDIFHLLGHFKAVTAIKLYPTTCVVRIRQLHLQNSGRLHTVNDAAACSIFRRLQNKTQVFPLPGSIFVHNRLTHSMEVACVGRSIAREIARGLSRKYKNEPWVDKLGDIPDIVAAACLAHDLGNPPSRTVGDCTLSMMRPPVPYPRKSGITAKCST